MTVRRASPPLIALFLSFVWTVVEPARAVCAPAEVERPVDLLVVAPHPDDEALCCSGVIAGAVARGQRVHVIVMTTGGTWAAAAAQLAGKPVESLGSADFAALAQARHQESLAAMQHLGVPSSDVTMLGYPDNLTELYDMNASPAAGRAVVIAGLARLVTELRPREVFAPGAAETHPTHLTTHRFVRDALSAAHWHGHLLEYVIHSGAWQQWPWPATVTPTSGFEAHDVDGLRVPYDVAWPPPVRVPLSSELVSLKLSAIHKYASQVAISQTFLEAFVKDEEIFWSEDL